MVELMQGDFARCRLWRARVEHNPEAIQSRIERDSCVRVEFHKQTVRNRRYVDTLREE